MTSGWTRPADVVARVRRKWDDGSLLRAYARGEPLTIDIRLKGPSAARIGDDVSAVRSWVTDLEAASRAGSRFELTYREVGGRLIGRNRMPDRAIITSFDQAWALLGVTRQVQVFDALVDLSHDEPEVHAWMCAHPLQALAVGDEWPQVIAARTWLDAARGSQRFLRQIDAPGVDTKFVETHRGLLAALLGVSSRGFVQELGLQGKPQLLRLRWPTGTLRDVTAPIEQVAQMSVGVRRVLIVENEITFLSVPVPLEGAVIWGKGFDVGRVGAVPWLRDADVDYWGDLDTHGFAILNQLRAVLPQTRSLLMDRETLLAHRERWGSEPSPTSAVLHHLSSAEQQLYVDLVEGLYALRLRLEQERIDWAWALSRLPR